MSGRKPWRRETVLATADRRRVFHRYWTSFDNAQTIAIEPALRQLHVSLEEAAENLGAGKLGTLTRIVVPLMTGGLLAGFVTSFATAAV